MAIAHLLIASAALLSVAPNGLGGEPQQIADNLVVKKTTRFQPGKYFVRDAENNGVIQIGADNITVDLSGVELWGGRPNEVDQYSGIGISLNGHKNVTIRNASVHGYRLNIRVTDATGVQLLGCDVSLSRGPVISDRGQIKNIWLSLYNLNAWRQYGAGIWIENSKAVRVANCRGSGSANGLLVVGTTDSKIEHNDFSFNSGWGIGLFGSSRNEVFWNAIDFVGRPWAGSVGADAAALVVVQGSCKNWIIGNSFSHSGDGFFLTNRIPSEDNVVALNDGSYSPHNAFEGTFSQRNIFVRNLANHSHYGFWLGYSSNNIVLENKINNNGNGIAIEHAVGSILVGNEMIGTTGPAVNLWGGRAGFPSKNSVITGNTIRNSHPALLLNQSEHVTFKNNIIENAPIPEGVNLESSGLRFSAADFWKTATGKRIQQLEKQQPREAGPLWSNDPRKPKGLFWYKFDRWAPHDFRKDDCFFAQDSAGDLHVWIAHEGWKPSPKQQGFSLKATKNTHHSIVHALASGDEPGGVTDRRLVLMTNDGKLVHVPFQLESVSWKVKYFQVPEKVNMADKAGWKKLFSSKPELSVVQNKLSDRWLNQKPWGGRWAMTATTKVKFNPSKYKFITASDDGVRVLIDGKIIIENWDHHATEQNSATVNLQGTHSIEVHYCQDGGGSAFGIEWQPAKR